MSTTVLRLAGPLMAWPDADRYRVRRTREEPTFSALQGLLCAAAGIGRGAARPDWITGAALAARVDRPGSVLRDFHTVNPRPAHPYRWLTAPDRKLAVATVVDAEGKARTATVVTERFYRQDQVVTVYVDDPAGRIADAMSHPVWAPFAGRKACAFSFPLLLGHWPGPVGAAAVGAPTAARLAGSELEPLAVTLYQEPVTLVPTSSEVAADDPTGQVGQGYGARRRWYTTSSPPELACWSDVMEALNVA